ncbi:MAG: leucyl/phenylalanyl-tRNA--protein transferase [Desulfuromonadales bacterium]|nr:leucyl/phenylalanyl-tRNA--protein transferase [Desulfuromonadales bacterium]
MPIFRLSADLAFPDPSRADPCGLLAVGGDLSVERLLLAYRLGIFPWYGEGEPLLWWSPDPRCVLFPDEIHVSRRLRRTLAQQPFRLSSNRAFARVVADCADVRLAAGEATWLSAEMQAAYLQLHRLGYAHSLEAWQGGQLVGGLYGLALGPFFFGESMFSRARDASKVVLVTLVDFLGRAGFELFDCQVTNPHLLRMGAREIPRHDFLARLRHHAHHDPNPFARFPLSERLPTKPL